MKFFFLFLILTSHLSLFAGDERGDGGSIFDQQIANVRKSLIVMFKDFSLDGLDTYSTIWWQGKVTLQETTLTRAEWMPTLLRKVKIYTSDFACDTHEGQKPTCAIQKDNGDLEIYLQTTSWEKESVYSLQVILIHEVGHFLKEKDHSLLTSIAMDFLDSNDTRIAMKKEREEKRKKEEKSDKDRLAYLEDVHQKWKEQQEAPYENFYLPSLLILQPGIGIDLAGGDFNFGTNINLLTNIIYSQADNIYYGFSSSLISLKSELASDSLYGKVRLAGFVTLLGFQSKSEDYYIGLTFSPPAPLGGVALGYNGVFGDGMKLHQVIFSNISLASRYKIDERSNLRADAYANMAGGISSMEVIERNKYGLETKKGIVSSGSFGFNGGLNFTYLYNFGQSFATGIQYTNDFSINVNDSMSFDQAFYLLLDFTMKHSFLIYIGPEQQIGRQVTERLYNSDDEVVSEKEIKQNKKSIGIGVQLRF
jgi:hypothetical protein